MKERARRIFEESIAAKKASLGDVPGSCSEAAGLIAESILAGGKVLACGNGGSAADAQHFAGEMVVRYARDRRGFPALALTTDSSVITAQSNDKSFDTIFSRQVESLGRKGDVLLAITTSGTSPDVLEAVKAAREKEMLVVGMTGNGGAEFASSCDVAIVAATSDTPRVQEIHVTAIHAICELVETELCGGAHAS